MENLNRIKKFSLFLEYGITIFIAANERFTVDTNVWFVWDGVKKPNVVDIKHCGERFVVDPNEVDSDEETVDIEPKK